MKCPNCGSEMAEGSLYCEKCGEDIHIVPDFEPELERNIEQTIHTILEELHEDRADAQKPKDIKQEKTNKAQKKKRRGKAVLAVGILAVLTAGTAAWSVYGYYSIDYQVNRAMKYVAAGRYDKAISCYNRALELDGSNIGSGYSVEDGRSIELIFELAEVYRLKNNKIEYEYLLREIIKDPKATAEQLEGAYDKLIAIYRARGDYLTINELLLGSNNENLISTYQSYIAREPEFSVKEGYYTSIQPLKLTAVGTGKIYYTMDGTVPTEDSVPYTAPIILENGDYVVSAYFVNDRGIASDIVSKEYHIENDEIPPPELNAMSGEYYFPLNIEVTSDDDNVYYTTDGTEPTHFSNAYTGPIPMPLGKSIFKFAKIVEGVTGTVAERTYILTMNTDLTPEQAVASVVDYSMRTGKIYDEDGHFDDSGSSYCYEYQYVTNINHMDDFYVIAEIFRGADGSLTKTGNHFAVNAYTGELFRLQQDNRSRWELLVIEEPIADEED